MKLLLFIALMVILMVPFRGSAQADCSQLVWADEFEGTGAPMATHWNFETGGGGWGNNELQNYTNSISNAYVSNGSLKIHARKNSGTWTSARMVTSGKASWKYGRFEIKAKLPSGKGTWPALWMMPQNSVYGGWPKSGEIDIMEHVGYDPGKIHGTAHTEAYYHKIGTQKGASTTVGDFNTAFHLYSIEWTQTEIKWFVDGKHYFTFLNENKTYKEWPFDQPFFLIFNIAIGGDWGGAQGIDPNLTDAIMEIDYVRVYSNSMPSPVITGQAYVTSQQQVTFSVTPPVQPQYKWNFPPGVTVVSGAGTANITVNWNDQPGQVTVEAMNTCDTVTSVPFSVGLQAKPEGEFWQIPITGGQTGALLWSAIPGADNQISLRVENGELVVTYNVQNPSANPNIELTLPSATDLTRHNEMSVQLMAIAGMAPYNIRIDLVDIAGQYDLNDLFKIDNPTDNGQFQTYTKRFSMNTVSGWQPSKISTIKIYFNYGILGKRGSGEFRLKALTMKDPNFTVVKTPGDFESFTMLPNPITGPLEIRSSRPFSSVRVHDLSGRVLFAFQFPFQKYKNIDLSQLKPGIYIIAVSNGEGWKENRLTIKQ